MPPHRFHASPPSHADDQGIAMRSALFVPGDDDKKLAKAIDAGADALIVDLEDSVALEAKQRAREIAAEFLRSVGRREDRPRLIVRVNPLAGDLTEVDLDAVTPAAPDCVMLPKSLDGASVQRLAVKIAVREARCGLPDGSIKIVAIATESAEAIFGLASYRNCSSRLEGLTWGGEDLSADLGAEANRRPDGAWAGPYALARHLTLLAAVAANVAPIDTVFVNFRDLDGLRAEAIAARRDGFSAKMAIHPAQVPIINEVFTPNAEATAKAEAIVAAFAARPGVGVVAIDGEMVDRPHLKRAERVLARAQNARERK
jgi:citrate lyase subunit beta/citryl-CoA lyase